jgi:hypothetical protein
MPHTPRLGAVVLYDNGWDHNEQGRPHVVVAICATRGVRLCPLTSTPTPHRRLAEVPLPAGAGNIRRDSWVAATDAEHRRNQLLWADPSHVGRQLGQLTVAELTAVKLVATAQVRRFKARILVTV